MTRDELREKVARDICCEIMGIEYDLMPESTTYLDRKTNPEASILDKQEAREISDLILDTIFAELKKPTEDMMKTIGATSVQRLVWQKMLAASPLAPEGGKD